jgi:hypothetical protein
MKRLLVIIPTILIVTIFVVGCSEQSQVSESVATSTEESTTEIEVVERESKIPADQEKVTPEMDLLPPILHSDEYEGPIPMPYPINTAGAEDSGFMMPDGKTFYVCFTPDPSASL